MRTDNRISRRVELLKYHKRRRYARRFNPDNALVADNLIEARLTTNKGVCLTDRERTIRNRELPDARNYYISINSPSYHALCHYFVGWRIALNCLFFDNIMRAATQCNYFVLLLCTNNNNNVSNTLLFPGCLFFSFVSRVRSYEYIGATRRVATD